MTKRTIFFACLVFLFAFLVRAIAIDNRAPFDWDQNRDLEEVIKIRGGEGSLLGPIVKGAGGFYLGPLYYYLLVPSFTLMKGNPSALPLTSVIFDSLAAVLIFLVFKQLGWVRQTLITLFYILSWHLIEASRISWNVALSPLFIISVMAVLNNIIASRSAKNLYLWGFLFGLSFHIHVSLIPLIPLLTLLHFKKFAYPLKAYALAFFFFLAPLTPLIVYDLNNHLLNLKLAKNMFFIQKSLEFELFPMIIIALTKLGKVISGIIFSRFSDNIYLGLIWFTLAFIFLRRNPLIKIASEILVITTLLIVLFHDPAFPEYYFIASYLPIIVIFINSLFTLSKRGIIAFLIVVATLALNLASYTRLDTPYSLNVKKQLVLSLRSLPQPLHIKEDFTPGRGGGIGYLLDYYSISRDPNASSKVILTDNVNYPSYFEGELAVDQARFGQIKTALFVVQ